jgi:hypothetical protein
MAGAHHARFAGVAPGSVHEYAFLTFHKSGTELSLGLARTAASELDLDRKYDLVGATCYPNAVAVYTGNGFLPPLEGCPDLRAVIVVRRPSTMLISDYAYTRELSPQFGGLEDYLSQRTRTASYKASSLSDGIKQECRYWIRHIAPRLHEWIQNNNQFSNVLQVSLEDFENNYDSTTRSVFEHFLGSSDPRVDNLVELARKDDLKRQDPTRLAKSKHVASASLEADAAIEVEKQLQAGDPCVKGVVEMDELLGYSPPF